MRNTYDRTGHGERKKQKTYFPFIFNNFLSFFFYLSFFCVTVFFLLFFGGVFFSSSPWWGHSCRNTILVLLSSCHLLLSTFSSFFTPWRLDKAIKTGTSNITLGSEKSRLRGQIKERGKVWLNAKIVIISHILSYKSKTQKAFPVLPMPLPTDIKLELTKTFPKTEPVHNCSDIPVTFKKKNCFKGIKPCINRIQRL